MAWLNDQAVAALALKLDHAEEESFLCVLRVSA
jgi:hypothetical protein